MATGKNEQNSGVFRVFFVKKSGFFRVFFVKNQGFSGYKSISLMSLDKSFNSLKQINCRIC